MNVMPHSLDHELALLALVLVERDGYGIAKGIVSPESFYSPAAAEVWTACGRLFGRGEPIDMLTVRAELVRLGKLEAVGGDAYLLGIPDRAIDPNAAESYARRIRDLARHRALMRACGELMARGYERDLTFAEYRAEVERALRSLTTEEADGEPLHISEALADVIQHAQDTMRMGRVAGRSTGLRGLDDHIGGWAPGRLYVVAGRPGMGKSALVTSTVTSTRDDEPTLAFSLEMPNLENAQRALAAEIGMELRDLTNAKLSRDDWANIAHACERLNSLPVYVDDRTRTLEQIVSKSRRFRLKHGNVGAIVVDYLQLIHGDRRLPREQQISECTREMKALAKELDCPVIVLSQLNRECEQRPDKRPRISDLRESGAIEQDADAILLLYRRGYYAAQAANETKKRGKWEPESDIAPGTDDGVTEIIVGKMRGGPTGTVKCLFQGSSARFVDLDEHSVSAGYGGGFGDE